MKNFLIGVAVAILAMGLVLRIARAQGASAATFSGSGPHTTCTTPVSGAYFLCIATDGVWVSNNGALYFQITAPSSSGVTSVQTCNLAGTTCGTAVTGAVVLKIPSTGSVTVPAQTVSATLN